MTNYNLKMEQMKKEWRNIPLNSTEIKELPLGFTATAFKPTMPSDNRKSQFIKPSIFQLKGKKN